MKKQKGHSANNCTLQPKGLYQERQDGNFDYIIQGSNTHHGHKGYQSNSTNSLASRYTSGNFESFSWNKNKYIMDI